MKLVKKSCLVLFALLSTMLVTTSVFADTVTLTQAPTHGTTGGGEFIATPHGGPLGTTAFATFCLEHNELISLGVSYNYVLSDSAVNGGVAGGNPDPISIGTAWLYSQFRNGSLVGYTGSTPDQDALQYAFWWLENEIALATPENNTYLAAASVALHLNITDAGLRQDAGANNYGVRVMNLTDNNGGRHQDQLAYVPEPSATLLFSLCLVGIGWFAHRKKFFQPDHLLHS